MDELAPRRYDRRLLALSIALQLVLGLVLGHSYDTRLFMATGFLAGTGRDPYAALNLVRVFHHVGFSRITSVGYPPPWPLLTGLIYRLSFVPTHNLLLYNLALKLPVIAANVGLAYLVAAILRERGASATVVRRAWTAVLLNPFLLYVGAAWGEIDPIVALLGLAALWLLYRRRRDLSAVLLALAFCVKPIALPLLPAALIYLAATSLPRALRYAGAWLGAALLFYVVPFLVLGWSRAPFTQRLNAHFVRQGALSFMTVVRLVRDPLLMQGRWWLLGLLWVPVLALGVAVLWARRGGASRPAGAGAGSPARDGDFDDLLKMATGLTLLVFLTRTWVAEPNVALIVPLVVLLTTTGALDRRALTAVWALPLVFTVFNASPLQLLWVAAPGLMARLLADAGRYSQATLLARAALVVAWQVAGWWIVVVCLRGRAVGAARRATRSGERPVAEVRS
jgi:Glycosyltransferase family 87